MKLFEEKLKKFQENSQAFNSGKNSSLQDHNGENNLEQKLNQPSINTYSSNRSQVNTATYNYKHHDKLQEKRRLYKANSSMNSNHLNKDVEESESNNKNLIENNVYKENNNKSNYSNKLEEENKELKQKIRELNNLLTNKEKSNEETIKELKNKCSQLIEERDNLNSIVTVIFGPI